ncbi:MULTISPECIES: MFS transporter [Priestia]|uniref:MFS transporter n=1 Tax=Priestia TaxID=2800373 RepID=UPI0007ABA1EA|nr:MULTISPECIES: MFS transporter [Priestia]KZE12976.1 MFS transporter [Priestia aryabhattai]MBY0006848.1 MFS transporter [Priestia aryabhattai]MBY0048352.1 MFS transporter [Priestia aryabhattai]MDE8674006.1 MFS transporter [Priestia aryabhattai]MED3952089.1 MFS transporter [Priestia aryabhattai]
MKKFALASYALYLLGGLVITAVGSVLPQLLTHYHVSYTVGGQLVLVGSLGFLIGVPLSSFLLGRFSEMNLLTISALMIALSQIGMLLLPPFEWIIVFNFLNGIGVAALEVVVATLMMEVFIGRRAIVMSYLEVSFGLGALLMPLIASLLISQNSWRYSFFITSILALLMVVVCKMIPFKKETVSTSESGASDANSEPAPVLAKNQRWKILALFSVMIFMYAGVESSMNNFLSSIFIVYLDVIPSQATLSISVFWVAMLIGRVATGWVIRIVTYERYLFGSIGGTIVSLVLFILLKEAVAGYILLAFLGLAMSGIYSITMVYANHTFTGSARIVTSLITGFSGLGGAIFPALIGFTMDASGIISALWYITAFACLYLLALCIIFFVQRDAKQKANNHLQPMK